LGMGEAVQARERAAGLFGFGFGVHNGLVMGWGFEKVAQRTKRETQRAQREKFGFAVR
jgi:hypothetical protein